MAAGAFTGPRYVPFKLRLGDPRKYVKPSRSERFTTVRSSSNEVKMKLQCCTFCTDRGVFEAAVTELTCTKTSYIGFCEEMCVPVAYNFLYMQ